LTAIVSISVPLQRACDDAASWLSTVIAQKLDYIFCLFSAKYNAMQPCFLILSAEVEHPHHRVNVQQSKVLRVGVADFLSLQIRVALG
jgi:hypothetical protein